MNSTLIVIFSFSIAIGAIIGWIRFQKINPAYYPFLYFIWIGFLNEIISYIITHKGYSSAINNNIYVLAESLLIAWQFKNWGLFQRPKYLFIAILFSFAFFWIIEGFFVEGIKYAIPYFRIVYSFVIVLISINMLNKQLVRERKNILKNSIFLICIAFVIYFTYKVIIWSFWVYGLSLSKQFMKNLSAIISYINLLTNLTYTLAVLWMPTKHRFSLPS